MYLAMAKKSSRCIERKFSKYGELTDFFDKLNNGAIEGLCDCVYVHVPDVRIPEWFKDKLEQCRGMLLQYNCPVSSSYVVCQV